MSWLSKAWKKVTKPVKQAGRFVDLTSSKSLGGLGRYTRVVAKPALATAAVGLTGGLALVDKRIRGDALRGYAMGAAVGGSILAAGAARGSVAAVAGNLGRAAGSTGLASSGDMEAPGALPGDLTDPKVNTPLPPSSHPSPLVAAAGAAAVGALVAGPVGAAVGGGAGLVLAAKKAATYKPLTA